MENSSKISYLLNVLNEVDIEFGELRKELDNIPRCAQRVNITKNGNLINNVIEKQLTRNNRPIPVLCTFVRS